MLLERTIEQLDIGAVPPERAAEMGRLGYMQWLAGLPGCADYRREALRAWALARPCRGSSPAVAAFCELLAASLRMPPAPLPLALPPRKRRGGARARRVAR